MMDKKWIFVFFLLLLSISGFTQELMHNSAGTGNPIIPGYFADPTVKKWGDTYYVYATTDGNGFGLGPAQVWTSKDFVNWYMQPMNWPTTPIYWAPDVNKGYDGKYYMYYSQPVELYGASSSSPTGPWTSLLPDDKPVVPNYFVPNVITLDGQTFKDDDGKIYMFWGTWGIYPNSGCGIGLLNADMKSFAKTGIVPNTIAKDFFEAPFMFKREGVYYLMYSAEHCEDETYKVHYVMSKTGPMGPFTYGKNSPVLVTNEDGTVHGPGHNSVLQEGDDYYIVYHRHNNPHSGGGFHRQVAADKLEFDEEGNIKKVLPTHTGIGLLAKSTVPYENLAIGKEVTASSYYNRDFKPIYAADDNNGTLWKSADNMQDAWWQVDLGKVERVRSILTQFEYATWYYQYLIEYSTDGKRWYTFADKTDNRQWGSPMKDYGDVGARYIRITLKDTQIPGLNKAIWNVKIFREAGIGKEEGELSALQKPIDKNKPLGLLVEVDAKKYDLGTDVSQLENKGILGGKFFANSGNIYTDLIQGKKAFMLDGQAFWRSDFTAPSTLSGNSSFTVSAWVFNPEIDREEVIVDWASGNRDLTNASIGYGRDKTSGALVHGGWSNLNFNKLPEKSKWHHIAVVFDGTEEKLYVDGRLENKGNRMLFLEKADRITIGANNYKQKIFSGALSSLRIYAEALDNSDILKQSVSMDDGPYAVSFDAKNLPFGPLEEWSNEGRMLGKLVLPKKSAEVLDFNHKLAVHFKDDKVSLLADYIWRYLDSLPEFTFTASIADNRDSAWRWIGFGKKGEYYYGYSEGVLTEGKKALKLLQSALTSKNSYWQEVRVMNFAVPSSGLKVNAEEYGRKVGNITRPNVRFSIAPKWLNENLAFMQADTISFLGSSYQYCFQELESDQTSQWQSYGYYLAEGLPVIGSKSFRIHVKDRFGNVWSSSPTILPANKMMTGAEINANDNHDFAVDGVAGTLWDGVGGKEADSLRMHQSGNAITLASAESQWDGTGKRGPFLYKESKGNFLAQIKIADLSGYQAKRPLGANEVGLMVRSPLSQQIALLQNGVMLGWGIGNIITTIDNGRRIQQNNGLGYEFHPYLQIQREGNLFFIRGSHDGQKWKELPGSPYFRPDLKDQTLQIGPYQASYGEKTGFGVFSDFVFRETD
ncbi:MAG TPA: family 43 glycosylhydrolase [Pseudosphingobacterium sp.]|nr:family 43 glycosylhydrolase [Pseudosphingobacterium sp.]